MKITQILWVMTLMGATFTFQGCQKQSSETWENTKSASRHMSRGIKALTGRNSDSRQINSREEFGSLDDDQVSQGVGYQSQAYEYVPLDDQKYGQETAMTEEMVRQPRETPGEAGSSIPGIDSFKDPSMVPGMAPIFKNVHFAYNSSLIKGEDNMEILRNIANYMKSHSNVYIFVEGHTDERGPEAYNLALGTRRSNAVRNYLVNEGVNPDHLFTISYGKERPLVFGNYDEAWSQNRRGEFKVYQR
jgi:peptidoglycan-associated lipoprotein